MTGQMLRSPLRCRAWTEGTLVVTCVPRGSSRVRVLSLILDRIPQILNMASELEFNLETKPRINCAAAGNPFPVRGSMELRKPDGTVLLVSPSDP
jgi:hypothetical protein